MDDLTFQTKNLEFHIREVSLKYDECLSKAINKYVDSDADFATLIKPCHDIRHKLSDLMDKYKSLSLNKFDH